MVNSETRPHQIEQIWNILKSIPDPEIPVISIVELGIVRDVDYKDQKPIVTITPTYSGCPAMDRIAVDIRFTLAKKGYEKIELISVLSPAWTTDWMTSEAKIKLKKYGIAPPKDSANSDIECPLCSSKSVELMSQFGSTPCKSLYRCKSCLEPFDYFKCH